MVHGLFVLFVEQLLIRLIYLPEKPLPPYSFVPAYKPHPKISPDGHLYNQAEKTVSKLDPYFPFESFEYLRGLDLFNNGYYWEAHEEWEGLWNAHNKEGIIADFFKALIKISASAVKLRQQQPDGAKIHSITANKMLKEIKNEIRDDYYAGTSLVDLIDFTQNIYDHTEDFIVDPNKDVEIIFDFFIITQ